MHVDPARRHQRAVGVDDLGSRRVNPAADSDDAIASNGDVANLTGLASSVDDKAAANEKIDGIRGG